MSKINNNATMRRVAGISFRRACLNIEAAWNACTPADIEAGARWYGTAAAIVSDVAALSGDTPETVAAVIAEYSPRTTWDRNVAGAYALCIAGTRAPGLMGANHERAVRALNVGRAGGDPVASVNGPKTNSFARNILGDRTAVTVDVWAARIAMAPDYKRGAGIDVERALGRAGGYDAVANAYRCVAARLGVDPTTLQAATWVRSRNGRAG
jgi:hypothetical protein